MAYTRRVLALASVVAGQSAGFACAVRHQGVLPQSTGFAEYIGKFCFDFHPSDAIGAVSVRTLREGNAVSNETQGRLYFMLFSDQRSKWKKARRKWASSTCEEKMADANHVNPVDLSKKSPNTHYNINILERIRPRFWYFTFVSCDGLDLSDLPIRYEVHATNDKWGWQSEFSLDHMGMFAFYLCMTVLFCIAGLATAWGTRWRAAAQDPPMREHPFIQLLTLAYASSCASCMLCLLHYYLFIHDGFGSLRIRFLGIVAGLISNCTMYLLAILASCGWAISGFELPSRRCFLGLVTCVGGVHLMCELYSELLVDQSTQLYSYQGSGGVFSLMLKIFMFCWFAFQVKVSYEEELEEKRRRFYKILGVSMSAWALNVPVTVLLAFQIAPWVRYKVVTIVDILARFLGLCLLSQLFCGPLTPITANNIFIPRDVDGLETASFSEFKDNS